ncbi:hypothetical protein QJS66_00845 [Kocuria rhizophila]|nr:hypothetical protein QJS66_00845 [Kocuria rhizophila]
MVQQLLSPLTWTLWRPLAPELRDAELPPGPGLPGPAPPETVGRPAGPAMVPLPGSVSSCRPSSSAGGRSTRPTRRIRARHARTDPRESFDASLPFALTPGQREVGDRVRTSSRAPRP